jgi:PKD repeat protein
MPITTGIAPLTVSFTDTSTGDGLSYLWAFGDGGTSTQSSPSYTYDDPGEYEATLLVQNTNGESQASQTVIVYEPTPMTMTPMTMTPMTMTPMTMTPSYGCFVAGTLVQLPNGIKYIEDIEIGDIVKSFDVRSSSTVSSKVTETFVHNDRYYMIINGIIKTTSVHPFYSDGNWIEAGDLSIGDKILHVDGLEHTVKTIELNDEPVTVYNFEVDGTHNYFAEGYLVHNKAPMGMSPSPMGMSPSPMGMGPGWKRNLLP